MNKFFRFINMLMISIATTGWISSANTQSWIRVAEIDSTYVLSVTEHGGALYANTYSRVFRSQDAGNSWQPAAGQPGANADFYTLFSDNFYLYLGTLGDGIFRSPDNSESWQSFNSGLPGGAYGIVGFTTLGDSLYAGTISSGVYVTNLQNPVSWSVFNSGLFQMGVNSINTSGNNLLASVGYYLFVRSRTASEWTSVALDSSGIQRYVYETIPVSQYLFAGTEYGVYRGTLDAQNWGKTDIAAFPNQDVVALTARGSRLIAALSNAGQHWIFSSDDMGDNWEFRAHEFAEAFDLFVYNDRLWAARSDGLWYFDMGVWTGIENPDLNNVSQFRLNQNYPNPFNPLTTIKFDLPKASKVTLKVFNILGEEVDNLVSERLSAGSYAFEWDASSLASGVYLYRLEAEGFVQTRKMILIR
ncbi:MAG: T9SS type A sorting domain-containing protein [Calditrichaeota bacterium]|nr:T9SS type A sorting domain-containing protein [Calditrichota bacterium]